MCAAKKLRLLEGDWATGPKISRDEIDFARARARPPQLWGGEARRFAPPAAGGKFFFGPFFKPKITQNRAWVPAWRPPSRCAAPGPRPVPRPITRTRPTTTPSSHSPRFRVLGPMLRLRRAVARPVGVLAAQELFYHLRLLKQTEARAPAQGSRKEKSKDHIRPQPAFAFALRTGLSAASASKSPRSRCVYCRKKSAIDSSDQSPPR